MNHTCKVLLFALSLLFFVNVCFGHFFLENPPSRGFGENTLNESNCGGFNVAKPAVYLAPNANMTVLCLDGFGPLAIYWAPGGNFASKILLLNTSINSNDPGVNFVPLPFTSSQVPNGTAGVVQLVYDEFDGDGHTGFDSYYYQCLDAVLYYPHSAASSISTTVSVSFALMAFVQIWISL